MSAGALVVSDNEIHLMSDGILSRLDDAGNWQVEGRDTPKAKPINDNTAILWLGAGLIQIWGLVKKEIENKDLKEAWEIANCVAETLKRFYNDYDMDMSARVLVVGFNSDGTIIYEITSHNDFQIETHDKPEGSTYSWAMVKGTNNSNIFPKQVGKFLKSYTDLKHVAINAFGNTIRHYEDKDVTVGGNKYYLHLKRGEIASKTAEAGTHTNADVKDWIG